MYNYSPRAYIQTKEFCEILTGLQSIPHPYTGAFANFSLKTALHENLGFSESSLDWIGDNTKINELLTNYIFPRHWQSYITYLNKSAPATEEVYIKCTQFACYLVARLKETASKYEKILAIYENNIDDLMAAIRFENESITKMNDTPQNAEEEDEYITDDYTTNIAVNKSTQAQDGGTKIARLTEIREKYENLFKSWADEFDSLFIGGIKDE